LPTSKVKRKIAQKNHNREDGKITEEKAECHLRRRLLSPFVGYFIFFDRKIGSFHSPSSFPQSKGWGILKQIITVHYHFGGSMELNAHILLLPYMVYL
jgi:hypothetical protein